MKALYFQLSGDFAIFKRGEQNAPIIFTYGNIHKVALLGIFGAILGYKGYRRIDMESKRKKKEKSDLPEFYQKLKNLEVAIIPKAKKGIFRKGLQEFNNSSGAASRAGRISDKDRGHGANLMVQEQILENPKWDIYILLKEGSQEEQLSAFLLEKKAVFLPYLGKNDHFANISNQKIVDLSPVKSPERIDSIFHASKVRFEPDDIEASFLYSESLPVALDEETHNHVLENMVLTDSYICSSEKPIYLDKEKEKFIYFQ